MKKHTPRTEKPDAKRAKKTMTSRLQVRCTDEELAFWSKEVEGDLSTHVRAFMPVMPVQ